MGTVGDPYSYLSIGQRFNCAKHFYTNHSSYLIKSSDNSSDLNVPD